MIEGITILIIIIALLTGIFFLCDDRKEVSQKLREVLKTERKLIVLVVLPVFIFFGYPLYIKIGVFGIEEHLWNPYIFCGMPAAAISGTGYPWYNLIYVFVDVTTTCLFYTPVGSGLFLISLMWFYHQKDTISYLVMLFVEILMLYIAYFGMGLNKGWLL